MRNLSCGATSHAMLINSRTTFLTNFPSTLPVFEFKFNHCKSHQVCRRPHCRFFCFSTSHDRNSRNSSKFADLPNPIEQQCRQWLKILQAEQNAEIINVDRERWWRAMDYQLKCKTIFDDYSYIRLDLDISQNKASRIRHIFKRFPVGTSVELVSSSDQKMSFVGVIIKHFIDAISVKVNLKYQRKSFTPFVIQKLKDVQFDIRKSNKNNLNMYKGQIEFLSQRHVDWPSMPGYGILLSSFGFGSIINRENDKYPTELETNQIIFDESQQRALCAILNNTRPIVAVNGPAGSGKKLLLAHYLRILNKQKKRVLVISSLEQLYSLMGQYSQITSKEERNFTCLEPYVMNLATYLIDDVTITGDIAERCHQKQNDELDEYYRNRKIISKEMNETWNHLYEQGKNPDDNEVIKEAKQFQKTMAQSANLQRNDKFKELLETSEQHRIVFSTLNRPRMEMFKRMGICFDAIVFNHAERFAEYECWWAALPLTSNLRLFGDIYQPIKLLHSPVGKGQFNNNFLLNRLNSQHYKNADGSDTTMNFHLNRQYRSNPALHKWPNRVFYKEKAAEPVQTVRDICLQNLVLDVPTAIDNLLLPTPPSLIAEPLVFVDLSKLEGGWESRMLEPTYFENSNSCYNWGEVILIASHFCQLTRQTSLFPSKIACIARSRAQHYRIGSILHAILAHRPHDLTKRIFFDHFSNDDFRIIYEETPIPDVEVMLKSFVTRNCANKFMYRQPLKYIAWQMTRAKRQFMLLAPRDWLEQGSADSRQLLDTFLERGRVIGPNDLCPLGEPGQFDAIIQEVERGREQRIQERRSEEAEEEKEQQTNLEGKNPEEHSESQI